MLDTKFDIKTLAKIGKGTKRKKREVNEIEVAEQIDSLYQKHNSLSKVARIVKLSPEMVRQIKSLTSLNAHVKRLYRKGLLKGYDVGYRLSKLSRVEQLELAKQILLHDLSSGDVRQIVKYRIDNKRLPLKRIVHRVMKSKNVTVYVAYLGIGELTFDRFIRGRRRKETEGALRSIFEDVVDPKLITHFELNGRVLILKVLKAGLQKMRNVAKRLNVPMASLADSLVQRYLERSGQ